MIGTITTHLIVFLIGLLLGLFVTSLCAIQKYDKMKGEDISEDNNNISEG